MTKTAEVKPRSPYSRSVLLAAAAFGLGFGTFVLRLADPDSLLSFSLAVLVFLLVAPALHVCGMVLAVLGIRRRLGRVRGVLCLLLHVVAIGLGIVLGGASLIDVAA